MSAKATTHRDAARPAAFIGMYWCGVFAVYMARGFIGKLKS
jgi:hypothetical protein